MPQSLFYSSLAALALIAMFGLMLGGHTIAWSEKDATTLLNQATYEFSQGKYGAAARHYREALRENPSDPAIALGLAMALKADGHLPEAKATLVTLIAQQPGFAPAQYNLGEVLEASGDTAGAKAAYRRFLELSGGQLPPSPEIRIKFRRLGLI